MTFLKTVLFLCVVTGQLECSPATINECVGPPPVYNNSTYEKCVGNQATGSCNCTVPAQTCHHGDQLYYTCDHGSGLDFIIICNYEDVLGERLGFVTWRNSSDKFEACTGSPAPLQSTPAPQPTFPPSNCSSFNVATWPPEGCIRLVLRQAMPNDTTTTGILQVYFNNTWGSVCHTATWNSPSLVNIACRMLGFSSSSARRSAKYDLQPGLSRDAWLVNIEHSCPDTKDSLWDCTRTELCWLTYAERGSTECSAAREISCKGTVNTTISDLTSCPPPTTTTPNPTTSGPDASTHRAEDQAQTSSSGHQSSPKTGLSTGETVGVVLGATTPLIILAVAICYRCNKRGRTGPARNTQGGRQQQPVGETDDQSRPNYTAPDESAQEIEMISRKGSDGEHSIQVIDKTSGTTPNPNPTSPSTEVTAGDPSQNRNAPGSDGLPQVSN